MTKYNEKGKRGSKDLTEIYFCKRHISNKLEPYTFCQAVGEILGNKIRYSDPKSNLSIFIIVNIESLFQNFTFSFQLK